MTFDARLGFNGGVFSNAYKSIGYVLREARIFYDVPTLLPKLEYASVVWVPQYVVHTINIEKVQRRFAKYSHFKLDNAYSVRGFPFANDGSELLYAVAAPKGGL